MSKDPLLYILIGILALHVLIPKYITATILTYAFVGYMIIIFIKSTQKKQEE